MTVPNGRFANYSGRAFELSMLKRGAGAAAGVGAAAGSVAIVTGTNRGWRTLKGATTGAGLGAASGCITGAVVGAIVASLPGCGLMALMGAVSGGFMGAYGGLTAVDEDGKIQVEVSNLDDIARITGDAVRKNSLRDTTDKLGVMRVPNPSSLYDNDWKPLLDKTGVGRFFPCSTYGDAIRQCIIINTAGQAGQATMYDSDGKPFGYFGNTISMPDYKICEGACIAQQPNVFSYEGTIRYASGIQNGTIFLASRRTFASVTEVPQQDLVTSPDVPAWAALLSDKLDTQAAGLKLSNQALAAILNKAHADMAPTPGVPGYDPNNPITPEEIAQQFAQNPALVRPTLGDLSRPWSTPGQDAQPTNSASTVAAPTPVQIVGGSTSSPIKAELDLGPAGDATMPDVDQKAEIPFWSQVTGALDPWRNLSVSWTQPSCPVYPINATFFAGRRAHWDIDIHCQLLPDGSPQDAILGIVLLFSYGLIAVRKALSA